MMELESSHLYLVQIVCNPSMVNGIQASAFLKTHQIVLKVLCFPGRQTVGLSAGLGNCFEQSSSARLVALCWISSGVN